MEGYRSIARDKAGKEGSPERKRALAKAKDIRLLLLDVDGVLTNGSLLYSGSSVESKAFNTQDGFGLRLLREAGVDTGLISARSSEAVSRRAEELEMHYAYQGSSNKLSTFQEILRTTGYKPYQVAYMGDDWPDLCLLTRVGLALAPANAVVAVKDAAHYVTAHQGGAGAVREACEVILEGKGLLNEMLQRYLSR